MINLRDILNQLPSEYSFIAYTPELAIIFNGEYNDSGTPLFVIAHQKDDSILLEDNAHIRYMFANGCTDHFKELLNSRNDENGYGDRLNVIAKSITNVSEIPAMFYYIMETITYFVQEGFQFSYRNKSFFNAAFETNEVLPYMGNYGLRIMHGEDGSTYKMSLAKYKKMPVPFTKIEYELGSVEKTPEGFIYHEGTEEVSEEKYQELRPMLDRIKRSCFDCRNLTTKNLRVFANCMDSLYNLL